jgi:chaperonin GroEL (HSP60 family)
VTAPGAREVALEDALVLVCSDAVETIRELLPALEQALQTGRPLVVVAPSIAKDVLGTLEVNAIQGKVPGVAVLADDAVRAQLVDASGAVPIDTTDRRSGWLDPQALGNVARWTSTSRTTRVVPMIRTGAPE